MIRANEIWNPVDRLLTDLENSDGILSAIFPISFQNISSVEYVSVLKLLLFFCEKMNILISL